MDEKINITPKALEKIKEQLEKRKTPEAALRLGLKGSGCSGYLFVIQFEDEPAKENDHILEFDGVKIFIDKKSMIYLNGMTLDWEQTLMQQGFKFTSEKIDKSCGCGKSYSFKDNK